LLRHAFVVERINTWAAQGVSLGQMMPYLAAYLGHSGANETFYYYHQVEEAFSIVRERDAVSSRVIPEAVPYEA
jgi:integrase